MLLDKWKNNYAHPTDTSRIGQKELNQTQTGRATYKVIVDQTHKIYMTVIFCHMKPGSNLDMYKMCTDNQQGHSKKSA